MDHGQQGPMATTIKQEAQNQAAVNGLPENGTQMNQVKLEIVE